MSEFNPGKELAQAVAAAIFTFLLALLLKALGAGKWAVAAGSGALGTVGAVALVG